MGNFQFVFIIGAGNLFPSSRHWLLSLGGTCSVQVLGGCSGWLLHKAQLPDVAHGMGINLHGYGNQALSHTFWSGLYDPNALLFHSSLPPTWVDTTVAYSQCAIAIHFKRSIDLHIFALF